MPSHQPAYTYRIRVEGHIPPAWLDWFGDLSILSQAGETTLIATLPDNPALMGLLNHLASLNLSLISVERLALETRPKE